MSHTAILHKRNQNPESWRYTDWRWIEKEGFSPAPCLAPAAASLPAALTPHRLVFVSGCYRPELSDVSALPVGLLTATDDGFCEMRAEKDHCMALAPVELLYLWPDHRTPTEAAIRLVLKLGQSARLTLIERHVGLASQAHSLQESLSEIHLAQQSKLVHGKIITGFDKDIHFAQTRVTVEKGAFYDRVSFCHGGQAMRCETEVDLNGDMAEARLLAVNLLDQQTHGDIVLRVCHNAPHGVSRQLVKTVLSDKARGVFQGLIHVAPKAQKTDAHQLGRALLLSNMAEMNAKPELEIFADDVKCSHGSTVGDLDDAALFYLRSRGIPAAQARAMLVRAFVEDVIDQVQSADIAQAIRTAMEGALS